MEDVSKCKSFAGEVQSIKGNSGDFFRDAQEVRGVDGGKQ
jgi:hypothetical protein